MMNIAGNALDWTEAGLQDGKSPLAVNWCGHQILKTMNLTRTRACGRADYQLIYLVNGKGTFILDGIAREVPKGSIVVYRPRQPQHYSFLAKDGTELYWAHFTGSAAEEYLQAAGLLESPVKQVGIREPFIELFEKIILELQIKKEHFRLMASSYFLQLLASFGREVLLRKEEYGQTGNSIKRVLVKIHGTYHQRFTVADLAGECNLSLYRFIHKFKAETGMTPVEYITKLRVNEAKKLLSGSSLNVAEVSSIVGYENPLYFSKVFRKVVGISPSTYKKQSSG
jgi:AraC-like DNA-binding protein